MTDSTEENEKDISDDDMEFTDITRAHGMYQNEIVSIESLFARFMRRYNACPAFFMGSLQDACERAFNAPTIKERRPVLVYIHNGNSFSRDTFCSNIFCSELIIDYLLENYIVWPWTITYESGRKMLTKIWEDLFSVEFFDNFDAEQCPMLIGIMRCSGEENDCSLESNYQIKTLLQCDKLMRTLKQSTPETVLEELMIFKEECDDNEQALMMQTNKQNKNSIGIPYLLFFFLFLALLFPFLIDKNILDLFK